MARTWFLLRAASCRFRGSYRFSKQRAGVLQRKKVFADGRENIHQNYFVLQHGGAVPGARRKAQHLASLREALFIAYRKKHTAPLDDRHLFVRMIVRRRHYIRRKAKAADHHVLADDHLSLNACVELFDRNAGPVRVLWLNRGLFSGSHFVI